MQLRKYYINVLFFKELIKKIESCRLKAETAKHEAYQLYGHLAIGHAIVYD